MDTSKRIWGSLDPFFEPGPVLGRKVANTKFLHALWQKDPFDEYHFFLMSQSLVDGLTRHARKMAPAMMEAGRISIHLRSELPQRLADTDYHCFHLSDCITSQPIVAALRNRFSRQLFPITGIIHSLSYADFGNSFLRHLSPTTTGRDAIVCTSAPGLEVVDKYFTWLREGYGLDEVNHPAPRLERIPLAVNPDDFQPAERTDSGPVRLLVFGRLSHHSKMDLVPLLRALHRLTQDGLDPHGVELVLAGWTEDDDAYVKKLEGMAANVGVRMTVHARPGEAEKIELFRSADVFVSIADNPQETFGITLAEAGAFGLPTIASEYDGYRDIVAHGETGLLIPTIGPDATPDIDALAPVIYDNQYHLLLAQRTAVSIPALAKGLRTLIESPDLRATMGAAARQQIESEFSWDTVMDRYVELWDALWQEPVDEGRVRHAEHPQVMPFGRLFGHYTSATLADDTMVRAGRTGEAFYRDRDYPTVYEGVRSVIDLDVTKKMVFLARNSIDTATLIGKLGDMEVRMDAVQAKNHILWALKHDILEIVDE